MKKIVLILILCSFSLILSVFTLELGSTMFLLSKKDNSGYSRRLELLRGDKSGTMSVVAPDSVVTFAGISRRINNLGFIREEDQPILPPYNTKRVLVYGDSVTFGVYLKSEETYPFITEQLLNSSSPDNKFEVCNMGRGASPFQYGVFIEENIKTFKPSTIVVQVELLNDVSDDMMNSVLEWNKDNLPQKWTGGRYKVGLVNSEKIFFSNIGWGAWGFPGEKVRFGEYFGNTIQRTLFYTYASRFVGMVLTNKYPPPRFYDGHEYYYYNLGFDKFLITPKRLEASFNRMFDILSATQKLCKKNNVNFLLLLTPSSYIFYDNKYQFHSNFILTKAENKAKALSIPYLSVKQPIRAGGGKNLFFDFCHLNQDGNKIIAESLYDYFVSGEQEKE